MTCAYFWPFFCVLLFLMLLLLFCYCCLLVHPLPLVWRIPLCHLPPSLITINLWKTSLRGEYMNWTLGWRWCLSVRTCKKPGEKLHDFLFISFHDILSIFQKIIYTPTKKYDGIQEWKHQIPLPVCWPHFILLHLYTPKTKRCIHWCICQNISQDNPLLSTEGACVALHSDGDQQNKSLKKALLLCWFPNVF